jgi:hypothetical protein
MSEQGTLSEDGNWWWDAEANEWKPVEGAAEGASSGEGGASSEGGESGEGASQGAEVTEDTVASMMAAAEQEATEA